MAWAQGRAIPAPRRYFDEAPEVLRSRKTSKPMQRAILEYATTYEEEHARA